MKLANKGWIVQNSQALFQAKSYFGDLVRLYEKDPLFVLTLFKYSFRRSGQDHYGTFLSQPRRC